MKKAKFLRKYYGSRYYDRDTVYMDYEYRGHEYTVYENLGKGNEPLAWQHRSEQSYIDRCIEQERFYKSDKKSCKYTETADYAIDEFLKFTEGDKNAF